MIAEENRSKLEHDLHELPPAICFDNFNFPEFVLNRLRRPDFLHRYFECFRFAQANFCVALNFLPQMSFQFL